MVIDKTNQTNDTVYYIVCVFGMHKRVLSVHKVARVVQFAWFVKLIR